MSRIIKCCVNPEQLPGDDMPKFTLKPKPVHQSVVDDESFDSGDHVRGASASEIAEMIVEEAKIQAQKIIDAANAHSLAYIKSTTDKIDAEFKVNMDKGFEQGFDKGVSEGRQKGYENGYNEGLDEADKIYNKNISFMQGIIEGIDDAKHMMLKKYENELSDIALEMARMIIKKELAKDPKALNAIIESAASVCKNQDYILVTLSQSAYNLITNDDESVAKILRTYSDDVRFFVDSNMGETDCIIETPIGVINASVDVQLDNIQALIKSDDNQDN